VSVRKVLAGTEQGEEIMRSIPVDVTGLKVIATGVEPSVVNKYADGVRQEATETDDKGRSLVRVSLFVITTEGAEEIRVKVAATAVPKDLAPLSAVTLSGLVAAPYVNNNRVAISYRAENISAAK
jgi:hypothetical protein